MDEPIKMGETWNTEKGELKMRFAFLTDHDLQLEDSKNEKMFLSLQVKLGKTKEELHKLLSEVLLPFCNHKK